MAILSSKVWSWSLASSLIIITLLLLLLLLLQGEREGTKELKIFLESLLTQPITSHRLNFI
jgi:hypothetical protein